MLTFTESQIKLSRLIKNEVLHIQTENLVLAIATVKRHLCFHCVRFHLRESNICCGSIELALKIVYERGRGRHYSR